MFGEPFARAWELYLAGSQAASPPAGCSCSRSCSRRANRRRRLDARRAATRGGSDDALRRADRRRRPGGFDAARERLAAPAGDVVVARSRALPARQGLRGLAHARVFRLLELDPAEYRATGLTLQEITGFRTGVIGAALLETRTRASSATRSGAASSTTSCCAAPARACSTARRRVAAPGGGSGS